MLQAELLKMQELMRCSSNVQNLPQSLAFMGPLRTYFPLWQHLAGWCLLFCSPHPRRTETN